MEDRKITKKDEELPGDPQAPKDKEIGPLDPNHPLLKMFREKAPGTFKHAQSLVSMIENVCSAIGMDPETLKIAATYHDIGKTLAPEIFSENQHGANIHDNLEPEVSYMLITRHVSDSIAILLERDFPRNVMKIVSQHHGTCVLRSIYEKAKEKDPGVSEEHFRYRTAKPDSVESMILMICDHVEATSRSVYADRTRDVDPAVLVTNMLDSLQEDGQFDEVQIVLGTMKKIRHAIVADVSSSFQKRVVYKEDDVLVVEKQPNVAH